MKIVVFTCNRAEFYKLDGIIEQLDKDPFFELYLVVVGSHLIYDYGDTVKEIKYDMYTTINTLVHGSNNKIMAESAGLTLSKVPQILDDIKPDCVLIHGDRFDVASIALACSLMNVYMVHLEGGEITGTIDDNIRHSISKLSQCHLVSTEKARNRLIQMGENPERVYFVGCPLYDKILKIQLNQKYLQDINGHIVTPREYIICIFHPVCNDFDNCLRDFECLINGLVRMKKTVIFFYPNIDNGSKKLIRLIRINNLEQDNNFIFVKNMNVEKYVNLLAHSSMIVGNSSSGIREACIFGVPSISIGSRQQNREYGDNVTFISVLRSGGQIYTIMDELYKSKKRYTKNYLYGDGKSIERIIKILKRINTNEIIKKFHQ